MEQFRKKPVVITATRVLRSTLAEVAAWCGGEAHSDGVDIQTLEGVMRAGIGDWIIKGVKGEFYPCKPDIFDATYELVEE